MLENHITSLNKNAEKQQGKPVAYTEFLRQR